MDNVYILGSVISRLHGDTVGQQFEDWAKGESLSLQNRNAMKLARSALLKLSVGRSAMALFAAEYAEALDPKEIEQECEA